MMLFLACAALMLMAALAFVLLPLLRHQRASNPAAERLRALDAAREAGVVDAEEYARKRAMLGDAPPDAPRAKPVLAAIVLAAFFVPAAALTLYRFVGSPQAIDAPTAAAADEPAAHANAADMQQAITALAERLKQQPDDAQGWALLGRAYAATGQAKEALDALRHAHELAGDDSALTVEYAQALALGAPDHRIDGESRKLLEGVIAKEPDNQRALWLLGISDYQAARYDAAIARWDTLLPLVADHADVAASVRRQIVEAQARRDGKAPPEDLADARPPSPSSNEAASPAAHSNAAPMAAAGDAAHSPKLTVQVQLDPKFAAQLDPSATLFVFARAASGPPMPLAIQRLKASQLPLTVTLDDSMGMMPSMKLSMFPQVVVGARISKSGNALPSSGDLQTLSAPIDVHRSEPIELTIDQAVP